LCKGPAVDITKLPPVSAYLVVSPTLLSSPNDPEFQTALSQYFGVTAPAGYNPLALVLLDLPMVQFVNTLFNTSLQAPLPELCFPAQVNWLIGNQCIESTPNGDVVLAFLVSASTTTDKLTSDFLSALSADAAAVVKAGNDPPSTLPNCKGCGPVGLFMTNLQVLLDLGDLTIGVVTSDLNQTGALGSETLLDLSGLPQTLTAALSNGLTWGGYVGKFLTIIDSFGQFSAAVGVGGTTCAETAVGCVDLVDAVWHAAQVLLTSLDLIVEVFPPDPEVAKTPLYQDFENGLNVVTSFVDPAGTGIVPSISDAAGNVVLGYDPSSGGTSYAGPAGILFPYANGYMALLTEDPNNPTTYTETLNSMGGSGTVPYTVRVLSSDRNQAFQGYAGAVPGGSSVPVSLVPDPTTGGLTPQKFLAPAVYVQPGIGWVSVIAKAFFSDGSATTATSAMFVLNGQQTTMIKDSASTFHTMVTGTFANPTPFAVYMIAPGVAGGFASGVIAPTAMACDLNLDGSVNVVDLQLVLNQALGLIPVTLDLNGDGDVDVADVQIVANAVLRLGCSTQ
jgi:hypothetical protein